MRIDWRKFLLFIILALPLVVLPASLHAQRCGHWLETVVQSFIPRQVDEELLRSLSGLSPSEYFQGVAEIERKTLADAMARTVAIPDIELRLHFVLKKFYDAGSELYGIRLNADNFGIVPDMTVNAFATGSWIGFNQGTLEYFLSPAQYLIEVGAFPRQGYTVQQYNWLVQNFGWQDDWNSIYFILAHEAAHNLMRHRDEQIWSAVLDNYNEYRDAISNYRKDIAHGRTGGGVKRYLWKSLSNFLDQFSASGESRRMESEADVVATLLLMKAGFDPSIAPLASDRMAKLVGPDIRASWQNAMTEVLCSTHPDWMLRIAETQRNLNCARFSGSLCDDHIAYPVDQMLSGLKDGMDQLDKYHQDTIEISERVPSDSDTRFQVRIEVNPKDAQLLVDGKQVAPGTMELPVGRHEVSASKEGFEPFENTIVVYPDVHPKIKIKLKRKKI